MKAGLGKINFKPQLRGLTRREFILIVFLIIAIEGYLLYTYLVKPAYDAFAVSMTELQSQLGTLSLLKADYDRKAEMEQEILNLEGQLEEIHNKLPAFLSQEEVVLSLEDLSGNSGLLLKIIGFSNASSLPFKAIPASGGEARPDTVTAAPVPMFVEQLLMLNFSGDYSQLYSFLKSVETSERKISAKSISVNVDPSGKLGGTINLSYPSLWNEAEGQMPYIMEPAPSFGGKGSPFDPYKGYSSMISSAPSAEGRQAAVTPDFYIRVNSYLNNSAKVFISNSYNTGSEARYDANDRTRASMTINGGDGKYTYQYTLGSFNIVGSKQTDIKDGRIRIEVLVQSRRSTDDNVGLILDLTNNTDVPVEITVKGDDQKDPRFVVGNTAGNVIVK